MKRDVDFEPTFRRIVAAAAKKARQEHERMVEALADKKAAQRERHKKNMREYMRRHRKPPRLCAVCGSRLRRPTKFTTCKRCEP